MTSSALALKASSFPGFHCDVGIRIPSPHATPCVEPMVSASSLCVLAAFPFLLATPPSELEPPPPPIPERMILEASLTYPTLSHQPLCCPGVSQHVSQQCVACQVIANPQFPGQTRDHVLTDCLFDGSSGLQEAARLRFVLPLWRSSSAIEVQMRRSSSQVATKSEPWGFCSCSTQSHACST